MQYVVGEVNSNSMKKSEAAGYILSIFALDKNNSRVKDNLTTLFDFVAADCDNIILQKQIIVLGMYSPDF